MKKKKTKQPAVDLMHPGSLEEMAKFNADRVRPGLSQDFGGAASQISFVEANLQLQVTRLMD